MKENSSIQRDKDKTFIRFGKGRIVVSKSSNNNGWHSLWIGDSEVDHEIGLTDNCIDWDKEIKESFVLKFNNVKSVEVVINYLYQIKMDLEKI